MQRWSRSSNGVTVTSEKGSASLEFLTGGLILLIPLVYLVVALSTIQGGALAVEGAARQAARVYVQSPDAEEAGARAARAVEVGLADYGIDAVDASVRIDCETPSGCLTRQRRITVTVGVRVALPLVPDVLSLQDVASVPVRASATQTVSRFWGGVG
jgi:Flp pilus assembly protein TadG